MLLGHYGDMTQDEHIELLQLKDEELDGLKTEIMKEQQVNSHVQMVQVSGRWWLVLNINTFYPGERYSGERASHHLPQQTVNHQTEGK